MVSGITININIKYILILSLIIKIELSINFKRFKHRFDQRIDEDTGITMKLTQEDDGLVRLSDLLFVQMHFELVPNYTR